MQVNDTSSLDLDVDYSQILPIQQKRTIAFINHFVLNTVSFLNHFATSCESRLLEFEYKLQKVEASLLILESQLNSIPGLDEAIKTENVKEIIPENLPEINEEKNAEKVTETPTQSGPICSEDSRFKRFFKMLQFGVPAQAVKLKMETEGFDPNILDTPTAVIPGGSYEDNQNNTEESD